jgi:putative spermidine/putrescine transport system ATP-binding protein
LTSHGRGASLELRGLVKRYGDAVALDGISLTIPRGEFVTLLGPSGSGKTTTLNLIAGFIRPDEGDITLNGELIEDLPPYRRNLGMVFQNYALFPHMTVSANVAFPLKQRKRGRREIDERVGSALSLVGLGGLERRYPRELSGGQQQRVALARALVFEPHALLMDEPLGALDKRLRESLQLEFKRIHSELGITFLYVTHDQDEALVMSDRIAVFNDGRVEQVGTAEELYERPSTLFVARFLGSSNVLEGRMTVRDGVPSLEGDGYRIATPAAESGQAGSVAAVVVRPERVTVTPASASPAGGGNVLRGRVRQVVYMGSIRRLEIDLAGDNRMIAQEQAGAGSMAGEGDEVLVSWNPDDAVLLPSGGGPPAPGADLRGPERRELHDLPAQ